MYFDPAKGREQSGRRPAVIISGNVLNKYLDIVIVCPLTTSVKNYKGNVVVKPSLDNNLKTESEVLTFNIRSVSKERLKNKIGKISIEELNLIKEGLNDILKY